MLNYVRVRGGWRLLVCFSTLGCVGYVELFRTRYSHKTEHPPRDFFILLPPEISGLFVFVWCDGTVGFGCIRAWVLGALCLCYRTSKQAEFQINELFYFGFLARYKV